MILGVLYTIPSETGLKQYYIKGEYTDEHFGTGKVIAPMEETSGNERFYVMALEDINPGTGYYWYNNASGNLDSSYNVSITANDFAVAGAKPTGRINTQRMITVLECRLRNRRIWNAKCKRYVGSNTR